MFWELVRAKYAGSRYPSCLSFVHDLLACGGTELGLRKGGREGSGKVVVRKTASAATAFGRPDLPTPYLAFRAHPMENCKNEAESSRQSYVWI